MATETVGKTNGYTFLWRIGNISHCWLKTGEKITSPAFIADELEGTKWSLVLYPMGFIHENYVTFYFRREEDCRGPKAIKVNFQRSFLDKHGSFLKEEPVSKRTFNTLNEVLLPMQELREKVFVSDKEACLSEDTLTVQCTIWNENKTPVKPKLISARTNFKVNRRAFVWKIDDLNAIRPGVRNKFEDDLIGFDLVLNGRFCVGNMEIKDLLEKLGIDITSFHESIKYFSFKISIENAEREKEEILKHEYFPGDFKIGMKSNPQFFKKFFENKQRYVLKDGLLLDCEYVSSNGTFSHELFNCGIFSPTVLEKEKTHLNTSALIESFKSMYNDRIFSDTELRTSSHTFPAHRCILSSRSPVFRRMFSNDMKEKNSGHVDIADFEDDTVHRMLLYMYTDTLEDLQLESAMKLYVIADKYEILAMRSRCSSFLINNLCPNKACDVLVVADWHQDDDLKSAVQDYILKHDKEVFGSQEWNHFMDSYPKLAADVMFRKVFPC